jgi:hypothetical protein
VIGSPAQLLAGEITLLGVLAVVVWIAALIQLAAVAYWTYEMLGPGRRTGPADRTHDLDAVQVRILTVDSETIVQASVDALPPGIDDCHVIAEERMAIDGATVHVVPEEFSCEAIRKGRALEWARRVIPCEKEYVLFLDEDTITTDLQTIPDADIVQFRERPARSHSLLSYLAEIYRLGFQTEQRAFSKLPVPLYAWGGGLAIRADLEDRITWDRETLIEDTSFVWRAMREEPLEFRVAETKLLSQAPPSMRAMVSQRSRWLAGSQAQSGVLPWRSRAICTLRNFAWAMSALVPFVLLTPGLTPGSETFGTPFQALSIVLFVPTVVWSILGVRYYNESLRIGALMVVLAPLVSVLHSAGALLGFARPPTDFAVTEKIKPDLIDAIDTDNDNETETDVEIEAEAD